MRKGTVVVSAAGHDKGDLMVVIKADGKFALVVDGKRRLLEKPKRKNMKHLMKTEHFIELSAYNPLYDAHILKELKSLLNKGGCCLG